MKKRQSVDCLFLGARNGTGSRSAELGPYADLTVPRTVIQHRNCCRYRIPPPLQASVALCDDCHTLPLPSSPTGCGRGQFFKSHFFIYQNKKTIRLDGFLFWCEKRDLNPYGCPHAPQTCASADSATLAYRVLSNIAQLL